MLCKGLPTKSVWCLGVSRTSANLLKGHNYRAIPHFSKCRPFYITAGERRSASRSQWAQTRRTISNVLDRSERTDAAELVSITNL